MQTNGMIGEVVIADGADEDFFHEVYVRVHNLKEAKSFIHYHSKTLALIIFKKEIRNYRQMVTH